MATNRPYGHTFPLHVPPIDWYFAIDDTPRYPMVFFLDLDFVGTIDREKMEAALEEACMRHPLTYSLIQPAKRGRLYWVPAPQDMPGIQWGTKGEALEDQPPMDMRHRPGLKIWVRSDGEHSRMTMQFHHAVCDGTGAYRFVGDLLACYMRRLPSCANQVELGDVDVGRLKTRPIKMRRVCLNDQLWRKVQAALHEVHKLFGSNITPLRPPGVAPGRSEFPGMVKREFSSQELAGLRNYATERGATLNDLVVAKLFQAIAQWNHASSANKQFRILVPSDMRDGDDFEVPACNMTAYTMVSRRVRDLADDEQLLESVRQDTLKIKHGSLQSEFVNGLTIAMEAPQILPFLLRRNRCLATCVLSNAGDPSRRFTSRMPKRRGKIACDDFSLEAITGVPPLRKLTRGTISSSIYGRKLTFSMRCDPHLFAPQDTQQVLDLLCQQLRTGILPETPDLVAANGASDQQKQTTDLH